MQGLLKTQLSATEDQVHHSKQQQPLEEEDPKGNPASSPIAADTISYTEHWVASASLHLLHPFPALQARELARMKVPWSNTYSTLETLFPFLPDLIVL